MLIFKIHQLHHYDLDAYYRRRSRLACRQNHARRWLRRDYRYYRRTDWRVARWNGPRLAGNCLRRKPYWPAYCGADRIHYFDMDHPADPPVTRC